MSPLRRLSISVSVFFEAKPLGHLFNFGLPRMQRAPRPRLLPSLIAVETCLNRLFLLFHWWPFRPLVAAAWNGPPRLECFAFPLVPESRYYTVAFGPLTQGHNDYNGGVDIALSLRKISFEEMGPTPGKKKRNNPQQDRQRRHECGAPPYSTDARSNILARSPDVSETTRTHAPPRHPSRIVRPAASPVNVLEGCF